MHPQQTVTPPREWVAWPLDDSEESVVGITSRSLTGRGTAYGWPPGPTGPVGIPNRNLASPAFDAMSPDGSSYVMLPDVFVHAKPNPHQESGELLTFVSVGVPLLAIEVLSARTFRQDLDELRGKAWSYADAGVAEYIVVDYGLQYTKEHVWARRLRAVAYR